MSLVAEVLPQVVAALQAFDPYERGVALNQLAQVRAPPVGRAVGPRHIDTHFASAQPHTPSLKPLLPWRSLARPGSASGR